MAKITRNRLAAPLCALLTSLVAVSAHATGVPIGGFIPLVGIGLTDEFDTFDSDATGTFFIADRQDSIIGTPLGPGGTPYYDIALLDTGAATHILTQAAASAQGFGMALSRPGNTDGFRGTNFQTIGGATGEVSLRIDDPLAIFAAGLGDRTSAGASLVMNTAPMRGQSSVAVLEGDANWKLPNILGLPMAAHHGIAIRNSEPQIFQHQGRTVRTPQVDFITLGEGNQENIQRRADLKLRPGSSFISGPLYLQNLEIGGGLDFNFHENPLSPTVVESGGLYIEVDLERGSKAREDVEFLFDTGADMTVVSQTMAKKLGFDAVLDTPDFILEVEGSGGVSSGIPGFYVDSLNIDAIGGSFTLQNVPIAVLNVTNPSDVGNTIDGILGMHLFTGRDIVIDAEPSVGQGGNGPSLYIGDPVYSTHTWAASSATANWATSGSWSSAGVPSALWDAQAVNSTAAAKTASVTANSTVYRMTVASPASTMTVSVSNGARLTTFGEVLIENGGRVRLQTGTLDAQFVNVAGGTLSGNGDVYLGTGPINGAVRNLSGRIEPGNDIGTLFIHGDLANIGTGTLAIEIGGTAAGSMHDLVQIDRFAFLGGTLEVSLFNLGGGTFAPSVGQSFTILEANGGIEGEFDDLLLPAGYQWDVDYQTNAVVLQVTGLASLAGDFNGDGSVDNADLTTWKQGYPANYTGADFLAWQRHVGMSAPVAAAVPEPAAAVLAMVALVGVCWRRTGGLLARG